MSDIYSNEFEEAFLLTMKFEVGPLFDPSDKAVQNGLINNRLNKRKVGYVNHPSDPGGETKFGIAQNFTSISVKDLTLADAKKIYYSEYWLKYKCDKMSRCVSLMNFDAHVNHRPKTAGKFLQKAVKAVPDGIIGNGTLSALNKELIKNSDLSIALDMIQYRENFYYRLCELRPKYKVFLNGWLNRISGCRNYILENS